VDKKNGNPECQQYFKQWKETGDGEYIALLHSKFLEMADAQVKLIMAKTHFWMSKDRIDEVADEASHIMITNVLEGKEYTNFKYILFRVCQQAMGYQNKQGIFEGQVMGYDVFTTGNPEEQDPQEADQREARKPQHLDQSMVTENFKLVPGGEKMMIDLFFTRPYKKALVKIEPYMGMEFIKNNIREIEFFFIHCHWHDKETKVLREMKERATNLNYF
jgi:hypothetical protein